VQFRGISAAVKFTVVPPFFVPKARFAAPGSIEHDLEKKTDADCQEAIFIAPPPNLGPRPT
jgi:hypothetical protein